MKKHIIKSFLYLILAISFFISVFPILWVLINASHHSAAVFRFPPYFWFGGQFMENFANLEASVHFIQIFLNSLIVALLQSFMVILISLMAAYAFAKFQFKGKNILFIIFLVSMMIPYQAPMLALFRFFAEMKLVGSYTALVLPGFFNIFAIFLLRQNFVSFPNELLECSRIDGCSEWRILFGIVLPNFLSPLAAVAIYVFIMSWNNFIWPLMITTEATRTLPVALSTLIGFSIIDYGQVMMGIILAILPIIVIFLSMQKYFIAGLTEGSIKS